MAEERGEKYMRRCLDLAVRAEGNLPHLLRPEVQGRETIDDVARQEGLAVAADLGHGPTQQADRRFAFGDRGLGFGE